MPADVKNFFRQTMSVAKGHSAEPPDLHLEASIKEVVGNMGARGTFEELRVATTILQNGRSVETAFARCTGLKPRVSAPKPPTDHSPEVLSIALEMHSKHALCPVLGGNGRLRSLSNVAIHPTAGSERRELFNLQQMREVRLTPADRDCESLMLSR